METVRKMEVDRLREGMYSISVFVMIWIRGMSEIASPPGGA